MVVNLASLISVPLINAPLINAPNVLEFWPQSLFLFSSAFQLSLCRPAQWFFIPAGGFARSMTASMPGLSNGTTRKSRASCRWIFCAIS